MLKRFLVSVEAFNGSQEREIPLGNKLHQRQALAKMPPGNADDEPKIGTDDLILHLDRRAVKGLERFQIACSGKLWLQSLASLHELEFPKVELEEEGSLERRRQERRAIEGLQIRRQITRDPLLLGTGLCGKIPAAAGGADQVCQLSIRRPADGIADRR